MYDFSNMFSIGVHDAVFLFLFSLPTFTCDTGLATAVECQTLQTLNVFSSYLM